VVVAPARRGDEAAAEHGFLTNFSHQMLPGDYYAGGMPMIWPESGWKVLKEQGKRRGFGSSKIVTKSLKGFTEMNGSLGDFRESLTPSNRHPLILRVRVDPTSYQDATRLVLEWARQGESRYVCAAGMHPIMEAWDDPSFRMILNTADLVIPDGMSTVWMLRRLGYLDQQRVCGPDLTLHVCEAAAREGIPVGFYGGYPEALHAMVRRLRSLFPALVVAYAWSPPFRPLSPEEDAQVVKEIVRSGARILFVGLGCPKQERWMAEHRGRVPAVMLGVGAAFDFLGGRVRRAPRWMQDHGLEWLFRLAMEPRRLWRRCMKHGPRFVVLALLQLWRTRAC